MFGRVSSLAEETLIRSRVVSQILVLVLALGFFLSRTRRTSTGLSRESWEAREVKEVKI